MDSHERLHEHINRFMKSQNEMNDKLVKLIEGSTENQRQVAETLDNIAKMTRAFLAKR